MNKEMIISSNGHETRVAILEDDQLAEMFVEREHNRGVVGNVYKGRVSKVLPGMQSSFIDLGLERDGFLYVSDVIADLDDYDKDDDEPAAPGEAVAATGDPSAGPGSSRAESRDEKGDRRGRDRGRRGDRDEGKERAPEPKIEELLKEGQDVIVQVAKEPLGTKGARLTCHVTLPGRFLVFMPTVDHIGISRKIDSRDERTRLRGIVREFREQHNFSGGVIIRTAASGRSKEDILADLNYFYKIWVDMRQRGETSRAPVTVYQEPSLVAKLLRDLLTDDYSAIRIDHPQEYQRVLEFIERIMPNLASRVKLYDKDFPIFEEYGVQAELDKALRSKVWLKSGGSIVINQTEALVAIDVNTGRYVGKKTAGRLEDTIIKTNLEAAKEIVRQIRLRDLGRHHRLRLHRHGGEEEPPEGVRGGGAGAAQGPRAVQGPPGLGLRPRHRDAQAREAEPRARSDRALPLLLGRRHHQVERHGLLRDPVRGEEGQLGPRRPRRAAPRQPRHREGPAGRGARRAARSEGAAAARRDRQARRPPASRAVRRDVDWGLGRNRKGRAPHRGPGPFHFSNGKRPPYPFLAGGR